LQMVQMMAPKRLIGTVQPVVITEVGSNSLFGTLTGQTATAELASAGA